MEGSKVFNYGNDSAFLHRLIMENYGLGSHNDKIFNWKYPKYSTIYSVHLPKSANKLIGMFLKKTLIKCPLSMLDAIPLLLGWREENAVKCDHLCMKVNLP